MPHIYNDTRLIEKLYQLLAKPDVRDRVYVYRLEGGKKIKPAVYIGPPFRDLEMFIRDNYVIRDKDGYCEFHIMIRRGETMLLSGTIAFALPQDERRVW